MHIHLQFSVISVHFRIYVTMEQKPLKRYAKYIHNTIKLISKAQLNLQTNLESTLTFIGMYQLDGKQINFRHI